MLGEANPFRDSGDVSVARFSLKSLLHDCFLRSKWSSNTKC